MASAAHKAAERSTKGTSKGLNRRAADSTLKDFKATDPTLFVQKEFTNGTAKRMIFIGDIHGCSKEFKQLLEDVKYTPGEDQVVLVGDLVAKGPDSVGVVRKAREIGAWCVRGNHDDPVIRWREFLNGPAQGMPKTELQSLESSDGLPYSDFKITDKPHFEIAREMSPGDFEFMSEFSVIMALPNPYSEFVVVHGGLDPSKAILEQNPDDVMTMRNIGPNGPSSEKDEGDGWFDLWAAKMKELPQPSGDAETTESDYSTIQFKKVIYGHDAGRALNILEYTKGLDSRCVYGGELTAFILPGETMVSVTCPNYDGEDVANDRRRRRRDHSGSKHAK
ncbi:hypothetical protein GGI15_002369 [Coemansia interrupta]|uniref:Calcineurin-like phosphoesterase domain-containing protein n=1 Tax=Coemansia interrupta TaxID=1126814 RepID=A0A9W8HIF5_9FUNG|nr:hypothetical protein GGI15_002369 [Coemansia interrupta]